MSDDLEAKLKTARKDLAALVEAWDAAWEVNLDYGPSVSAEPRVSGSHDSDSRVGLVVLDARTGDPQPTELSLDYATSVRRLADAVVDASRLSWVDDRVALVAALPPNTSHVTLAQGQRIAREVDYAVIGAQWRLERGGRVVRLALDDGTDIVDRDAYVHPQPSDVFTFADIAHLGKLCHHVTEALSAMPGNLHRPARKAIHPTTKRCEGAPSRESCTTQVPWGQTRCATCETRIEVLVSTEPRHHGEPCPNPWSRPGCTGEVEVPKHGLCRSCDQSRRNWLRKP